MSAWLEILLLLVALVVAIVLGMDLLRGRLARRRERQMLDKLETEGVEEREEEIPDRGRVGRRLRAAGVRLGSAPYLLASALLAVAVFLAVLTATGGWPFAALIAALIAAWLPWFLLGAWAQKRSQRFEEKLVDAVGFIASALQAGENPTGALTAAGEAAEAPAAAELRRVADRLAAGTSVREAVRPMVEGYDSEGVRIFSQTLIAKWTAGGELAPVLLKVSQVMRDRLALRMRLRAELAGARLGAVIIAVLPYLLLPVLLWRRPEWLRSLLEHPTGLQLLLAAILLQLLGMLWLRHILRSEFR